MFVQNMASLVVAKEKNIWLLWNKYAEDEEEEFFWDQIWTSWVAIGKNDGQKNSSAVLPDLPSPPAGGPGPVP